MAIIELKGIQRLYVLGDITVRAIRGLDLSVEKGEFVSVMGPSGSGKSTLMNVLGCLDKPSAGSYILDGLETSKASSDEFAAIRNEKIGFVFQGFNLLARTTAIENVELPMFYNSKFAGKDQRQRAIKALEDVGLGSRLTHLPSQLSGGQQQRVAIARAMVNDPAFILADEPTGNLASLQSEEIMQIFQSLNDEGATVVMVTHEPDIAQHCKRIVSFRDGRIIGDEMVTNRLFAVDQLETMRIARAEEDRIRAEKTALKAIR